MLNEIKHMSNFDVFNGLGDRALDHLYEELWQRLVPDSGYCKEDKNYEGEAFPLFTFKRPVAFNDPVEDHRQILFRRSPSGKIEFQSKRLRWSF
jgi:hypothetical protein